VYFMPEFFCADFPLSSLDAAWASFISRAASLPAAPASLVSSFAGDAAARWDAFYSTHTGGFFKPRSFLGAAFPLLSSSRHVLEVGCGSGSNFTCLLAGAAVERVYASELSASALRVAGASPLAASAVAAGRLELFLWDAVTGEAPEGGVAGCGGGGGGPLTLNGVPERLLSGAMDAVVLTFVASAVPPTAHAALFARCAAALAPGGALCFRDYAERDIAQLRAPDRAMLTPWLHARADGTLAFFFSTQGVRALLEAAGLAVEELALHTVKNVNRRTGGELRRVFVHAVGRKR
jgi:methyltransferase-like protein 6